MFVDCIVYIYSATNAKNSTPNMTRDETIQYLIDLGFVERYTTKLLGSIDQDIIQDIWVQILEIPESKWELLWSQSSKAITGYVSGLIFRNIRSCNSIIYNKYRKNIEYTKTDEEWGALASSIVSPPQSVWEEL